MRMSGWILALGMALGTGCAASAQPVGDQGFPPALRGTWAVGSCESAELVLRVTGASIVELPSGGEQRLLRARSIETLRQGWLLATDATPEQRRLMLRIEGPQFARPSPKVLDDVLPGDAIVSTLTRCASLPARLALLHGEGLRFLGELERIEAVCVGSDARACIDAVMDYADVSRDGALSVAELARIVRGTTYVSQLAAGSSEPELAAGLAAGSLAALALGQAVIQAVDYNGDGKAGLDELLQDRLPLPDQPDAGRVLVDGPLGALAGQAGTLRSLFDLLWGEVQRGMP